MTHNVGRSIIAWGGAQRDPMKAEAYKRDAQSDVARRPGGEPLATALTRVSSLLTTTPWVSPSLHPRLFYHDSQSESGQMIISALVGRTLERPYNSLQSRGSDLKSSLRPS
ncbi:MAG: hypothetical protein K2K94_05400 [Muribaculaceae bacterium]|nr:hypothetical protein [Muribaculaceae bacterium]